MRKLMIFMLTSALIMSCDMLVKTQEQGELRIAFARDQEALTRAGMNIPDTSDFILSICDSKGRVVYEGSYGDSPESMSLEAGSYVVKVVSSEFSRPAFSSPQFADEQCVVVPSGGVADIKLVCVQVNCGIRLKIDSGFLTAYPDGVLLLKSSFGRLVYSYSEKRAAYFKPGDISLVLSDKGKDEILMTRNLQARDMLVLKVGVASSGNPGGGAPSKTGSISVSVDTTRNWVEGSYVIGGDNDDGGTAVNEALTVSEALALIGEEDVWVSGYIVGGDLSSASASFEKPFSSRTNILIGPRSSTSDKNACLSVQLPAGELRDDLNLVDNPGLLGRKVCLRGDIVEAYYGIPGIKNVSEYELQ
ncbi:MAG: DUF4493 domain-containing protein [Bacteroidales bacterium]|nr:DUF4493 domain-containing protein [Bacteroidales bacterium]